MVGRGGQDRAPRGGRPTGETRATGVAVARATAGEVDGIGIAL